jgi:50S ribosomal protein L16 3-hydroxylase
MSTTEHPSLPLSTLISPMSVEQFLAGFPQELFVHHGSVDTIAAITSIPELQDVRAVAAVFNDPVSAWLPADAANDERRFGDLLRATDALERYERGAVLQFNAVERWVPRLTGILRGLELELGLALGTASCSLFASAIGGEVYAHFDADPAFSVQLSGSKRWFVAPQEHIENPLHNHVCGTPRGAISDYFDGPLPEQMPEGAQVVEMRPGSVLFIPRGYLHATKSHESSLSMTFDLHIPHWSQVLVRYLARRLNRSVAWRGHALGTTSLDDGKALAELEGLLPELRAVMDELAGDPGAVLGDAEPRLLPGPPKRYRRAEGVPVELAEERSRWTVRVDHPRLGRSEIAISPELAPLCRWMASIDREFVDRDALSHAGAAGSLDVGAVLSALIETGALEASEWGVTAAGIPRGR